MRKSAQVQRALKCIGCCWSLVSPQPPNVLLTLQARKATGVCVTSFARVSLSETLDPSLETTICAFLRALAAAVDAFAAACFLPTPERKRHPKAKLEDKLTGRG